MTIEFIESSANEIVSATIVDELAKNGVKYACISPGSRSTPLAISLLKSPQISTRVLLDERSSGFFALGIGKATGEPVVILTTSGTAATEVTPAVVEAYQSGVGLIVVTADRPLEVYDTGSPQTIDQTVLFSGYLRGRRLVDAGTPGSHQRLRATVSRLVLDCLGFLGSKGPVHLNVSFREPLMSRTPNFDQTLTSRGDRPWYECIDLNKRSQADTFAELLIAQPKGVIVIGDVDEPEAAFAISELLGWPTLVDPRSSIVARSRFAVSHHDSFLRINSIASDLSPSFILYLGRPQASKALSSFVVENTAISVRDRCSLYRGSPHGIDPEGNADGFLIGSLEHLVVSLSRLELDLRPCQDSKFSSMFLRLDKIADTTINDALAAGELGVEIAVMKTAFSALVRNDLLFVSSSMPMRDLETFGGINHEMPRVLENRGVNGIDGIIATFAGAAYVNGPPTPGALAVLVIGDLAFLYDVAFLRELGRLPFAAAVIVIDNNGGGIFSFLSQKVSVAASDFEVLFGTPHNADLFEVAKGFGVDAARLDNPSEITPALTKLRSEGGVRIYIVGSDREQNRASHGDIFRKIEHVMIAKP